MILPEGGTYQLVGRTGSGKTFYAVREMLELLCKGKVVYSNVKLIWDRVLAYAMSKGIKHIPAGNYRHIEDNNLSNFHKLLVPGSCIFIDEAQILWNARDFKKTDDTQREMLLFMTQARHQKVTICFITQHESNVDSQMARVAVCIVRMRNLLQLPSMEFWHVMLGKPKWMEMSFATVCDRDGKTVLDRDRFQRTKLIGDCYSTTQMHAHFGLEGDEGEAVVGVVKHGHPGIAFMLVGAFLHLIAWYFAPAAVAAPSVVPAVTVAPEVKKAAAVAGAPFVTAGPVPQSITYGPAPVAAPVLKGLARWQAEDPAENRTTDAESLELPRYYKADAGELILLNEPHTYHVGDVWLGARIVSINPESPTSVTVCISRTQMPGKIFYVRLYNDHVGIRHASRELYADDGSVSSGGDVRGVGSQNLENHAQRGMIPPGSQLFIPSGYGPAPEVVKVTPAPAVQAAPAVTPAPDPLP